MDRLSVKQQRLTVEVRGEVIKFRFSDKAGIRAGMGK
jgi:hypothetical protein